MTISVRNISKTFAHHTVLDNLSLDVEQGQLVTLLGPSGCGKTTLLRIIAGLERPDRGQLLFHGQDTAQWDFRKRNVGFVFQNYALFRHMTVSENISFGLRMRPRSERPERGQVKHRIEELLELVQLQGLGGRYPHQLSGGQSQRVALARALAIEPSLLLLDEPFGALDAKVRKDLRTWMRGLQQSLGTTCILVTHDQEEALEISDHIILLNQGRIEQQGRPEELFENPNSIFALGFLGQAQVLPPGPEQGAAFVRPHEIRISPARPGISGESASIRTVSYRGALARLLLHIDGPGHDEGVLSGKKDDLGVNLATTDFPSPSTLLAVDLGREAWAALNLKIGDRVTWSAIRTHRFPS